MKRQFTLQLHDVPPGRAFTCPTCNAASFHPSNVLQVVCKACSPFLEVKAVQAGTVAICRWATGRIVLNNRAVAIDWCHGNLEPAPLPDMPDVVLESLINHFETKGGLIRIEPPSQKLPVPSYLTAVNAARAARGMGPLSEDVDP